MASRPLVLLYHAFGRRTSVEDPHNLFVTAEAFEQQLRFLRGRGYTALDTDAYLAALRGAPAPRRSFHVTVDDGYLSTLETAAPILARHGVAATVFVSAGLLGGVSSWMPLMPGERLLDADGVRALRDHGLDVGVHGWDHRDMTGQPAAELRRQTVDARAALADLLGAAPRTFAYPRGEWDEAARRAVRAAGFEAAFATRRGDGGHFAIRRVDVNSTDTARSFRLRTRPFWPLAEAGLARLPRVRALGHTLVGRAR